MFGIEARQLNQRFIPSSELKEYQDRLRHGYSHARSAKVLKPDLSLLGRHQIDLGIKNSQGKLRLAEVKSKRSLRFWDIFIGKASNWADKGYHHPLLFLVDQNNGQVYLAPPRDQWQLTVGKDGLDCYSVLSDSLMPVEEWLRALKMPVSDLWRFHQQTGGKWRFYPSLG